jgi:uncharacterized protein
MKTVSALIKPASSLCNLRCRYCFYCDVAANRETQSYGIMTDEIAHAVVDRLLEATEAGDTVLFSFQGGEPTLAGVNFFRRFTAYAEERNGGARQLNYAMQTNGIALDDDFCTLLAQYHFLVGLSLDGDETTHNYNRVDAAGAGTHKRIMNAVRLLRKYKVEFNILSVVTETMARHPQAVFKFYMKNGLDYLQFIPCLQPLEESGQGAVSATPQHEAQYTLRARTYADFLIKTFRLWKEEILRGHQVSIRLFDNVVGMYLGMPPEQCGVFGRCQNQMVIEGDGSVYPCDFYVLDEFVCGNVMTDSVEELLRGERARKFLELDPPGNPRCAGCRFMPMCGGTCKRYRAFYSSEADFCPYETFLSQVQRDIAELVRFFRSMGRR